MSAEPSAGRSGPNSSDVGEWLTTYISDGVEYTRDRARKFRRHASLVQLLALSLSAGSTVILGLQNLNLWANVAFSLVALSTAVTALEPFFNWRSRWILMEDARAKFLRVQSDLRFLLVKAAPDQPTSAELDGCFARVQEVWTESSQQWVKIRQKG